MTRQGRVKCVVWDLDGVVWSGSLVEGTAGPIREPVREAIVKLDRLGILQSVASLSDRDTALARLRENGLDQYLLEPQIDITGDKCEQLDIIAKTLGFSLDQIAFVDDEIHQRAYVERTSPSIWVLDEMEACELPSHPGIQPSTLTEEGASRRSYYRMAEARRNVESGWAGKRSDFLEWCEVEVSLRSAEIDDRDRVFELVGRTNRFHASRRRYSMAEVERAIEDPEKSVRVARLTDRFGYHGLVGLTISDSVGDTWRIDVLAVSCRVNGLGVGDALLGDIIRQAASADAKRVTLVYQRTRINRPITLLLARFGFEDVTSDGEIVTVGMQTGGDVVHPKWLNVVDS